jgi:alpha-tubulin suppressor-like RCC1 family protein
MYATFLGSPAAWGRNSSGELGKWFFSPYLDFATPAMLPNGGVSAVAAGGSHSLALRVDGTVFAWGDNSYGQLGNGSPITPGPLPDSSRPVQVGTRIGRKTILLSQVAAIAAGGDFSLALKKDGTVWAWGYNADGELGNGTTADSSVPVPVTGLTDVIAIAAGDRHGLAVKRDGSVWSWGYNGFGQLGDLTLESRSAPVQVFALGGVTAVAGGGFHSLALLADGTVRAWGFNFFGQLGNGTTADSSVPVQVAGLTGVFAIGAGTLHSLAVMP